MIDWRDEPQHWPAIAMPMRTDGLIPVPYCFLHSTRCGTSVRPNNQLLKFIGRTPPTNRPITKGRSAAPPPTSPRGHGRDGRLPEHGHGPRPHAQGPPGRLRVRRRAACGKCTFLVRGIFQLSSVAARAFIFVRKRPHFRATHAAPAQAVSSAPQTPKRRRSAPHSNFGSFFFCSR